MVSFNFLCQAIQNGPFSAHSLGDPFNVYLTCTFKNKMQTTSHGSPIFTNSQISTLSGLGGVSGTSDWSKERKKKCPNWGKWVWPDEVESLCTWKIFTI